jgi:hypothetical protein
MGDVAIFPQYSQTKAEITTIRVGPIRTSDSVTGTANAVTHDIRDVISTGGSQRKISNAIIVHTFLDVGKDHLNAYLENRHVLRTTLSVTLCNSKEVLKVASILFSVISMLKLANIKQTRNIFALVR